MLKEKGLASVLRKATYSAVLGGREVSESEKREEGKSR